MFYLETSAYKLLARRNTQISRATCCNWSTGLITSDLGDNHIRRKRATRVF